MTKMAKIVVSLGVLVAFLLGTAGTASAAPSYSAQVAEMNRQVNGAWIGQFEYNERNKYGLGIAWFNWNDDGCSAPLVGNGPFNFHRACNRHDFGYRNLKRIENVFRKDVWRHRNKANVDTRFKVDMDDRCREFNFIARGPCYATAETFESGVRVFGGGWPTVDARYYSLSW